MRLSEVLKKFIDMEMESAEIYERAAEFSTIELKGVLRSFRDEEVAHSERIKALLESIPDIELGIRPELLFSEDFDYGIKRYKDEELRFISRKDLFIFALQGEKNTILKYSELRELLSKFRNDSTVMDNLIEEERTHMYYILKLMQDLK